MGLLDTRVSYAPFEYQWAYDYWEKQQQAHWLHCVAGTERVCTSEGLIKAEELYSSQKDLYLFDNDKMVKSSPMQYLGEKEVFKIHTKEGFTHTVTADHRVMTRRGWVEAQNLQDNDLLCIQTNEGVFGKFHDPDLAFLLGHYQGDGTNTHQRINSQNSRYPIPTFSEERKMGFSESKFKRLLSCKLAKTNDLVKFEKNVIPEFIWQADKDTLGAYLRGLFITDGTTYQGIKHESIKVTQMNLEYLQGIQILLLQLGIKSVIYSTPPGENLLPDGKGGKKLYKTSGVYTLEITNKNHVIKLNDIIKIFESKNKKFRGFSNSKKSHPIIDARFTYLEPLGIQKVYCVAVKSEEKAWICNGFITHNSEISLASDLQDWKSNLAEKEKNLIGTVLKGFTQAEIIVGDYWSNKVANYFKKSEIQLMANCFAGFETIHTVAYAYLNQTLGLEDFEAFLHEPTAKAKIDRLIETNGKSKMDIARSLAIFSAFTEGVQLFSSFAILLNFSRFNKFKGIGQIIAFSIRDESLHSEAGCRLFRTFISEYPEIWTDEVKKEIYEAARIAVQMECSFIDKCFEMGDVEGLAKEDLKNYIKYRANTKLQDLGLKSNWKNINKESIDRMMWFDILSSGVEHADFFAGRVSEYSKGNLNWDEMYDN